MTMLSPEKPSPAIPSIMNVRICSYMFSRERETQLNMRPFWLASRGISAAIEQQTSVYLVKTGASIFQREDL